ncbi:MAG: T9SS type A sorting domain-containing protein [Bacteroidetes bacterium]|nr:T9SS type A sorting domain-containing protein [Bacteroidota bacterium]
MKHLTILVMIVSIVSAQSNQRPFFRTAKSVSQNSATLLNINRLSAWYSGDGESERNPNNGNSGVSYPRGTTYAIYASGNMMGGYVSDGVSDGLRVTGYSYNKGFIGGTIKGNRTGITEDPDASDVRVYRIRRDYATADLKQDAAELNSIPTQAITDPQIGNVRSQYRKDWAEWPAHKGAPFYDADNDGKYTPKFEMKDTVEVPVLFPLADEPGVAGGDQVIWYAANDLRTLESPWKTKAIGLEMQMTIWGYNYPLTHGLGNSIFKRTRIIYKGRSDTPDTAKMRDFYIGQWSDPDLGDAGDDFAGCDSVLGIGYVYNSKTLDSEYKKYSISAASIGYMLMQGPIEKGTESDYARFDFGWRKGYRNIPMTSFIPHSAGSPIGCDPPFGFNAAVQFYQNLRGLPGTPQGPPDPSPYIDPITKRPTKFVANGDPVAKTGWLDGGFDYNCVLGNPGDRRFLTSSGPFQMSVGDTQEVVYALTGGLGSDHYASITVMKFYMRQCRDLYRYMFPQDPTGVKINDPRLPKDFILSQNYPNPFNPGTKIDVALPQSSSVTLTVYDGLGRELEQIVNGRMDAGSHSFQWNASRYPSGIYYYRLTAGTFVQTKKMILLK